MKRAHFLIVGGLLLLITGLSLSGVSPGAAQAPTEAATKAATPPAITEPLGKPPVFLLSYYNAWLGSAHAKADAEAFVHWNAEGAVPTTCAQCHSSPGYLDYLGADGSTARKVDQVAPVGSVINCDACHSPAAASLKTVVFPSGAEVGDIGDSTRCIVCHQGRASTVQVNAAIEKAGLKDDVNKVDPKLSFINIHYFAAAASLYGTQVKGGYEFDGKVYQSRNQHVEGYNTCVGCHNQHTLEVRVEECSTCHEDVKSVEDLKDIRMNGSLTDFDDDGSMDEGIAGEIEGLQEALYKAIQAYATKVSGKAIVYDKAAYPYFFGDANSNGKVDEGEKAFDAYTALLLQAAYNYQVSQKDPGNFAHNPKYHIQLLFDSIEALDKALGGTGEVLGKLHRNPPGHFDSTGEPFRHWDAEGEVPGSCAKCHTSGGLAVFLKNGAAIATKPSVSLACTTCHDAIPDFTVQPIEKVTFPSGATVSLGKDEDANICLNCHQGRESTVSVNRAIASSGAKDDEVTDKLTFRNVHYFAAGATLFGGEVQGAYQYEGKKYSGRFMHKSPYQTCTDCHNTHTLEVRFNKCENCHEDAKTPQDIRFEDNTVDYNGNGKTDEPILAEITTLKDDLLAKIYAYAADKVGAPIVYASANHPYWFNDLNKNGEADPDELKAENRFSKWTPNLLRAAYNYQYASKDPGVFAHNAGYILQVLYDSVESVGGKEAVAKYTRPEVKASD